MGPRVLYEVMVSKVSMSKVFKSLQVLGLQGSRGSRVNCEVQGFRRSPKVDGFKISYPRAQGSEGQGVSRHVGVYL